VVARRGAHRNAIPPRRAPLRDHRSAPRPPRAARTPRPRAARDGWHRRALSLGVERGPGAGPRPGPGLRRRERRARTSRRRHRHRARADRRVVPAASRILHGQHDRDRGQHLRTARRGRAHRGRVAGRRETRGGRRPALERPAGARHVERRRRTRRVRDPAAARDAGVFLAAAPRAGGGLAGAVDLSRRDRGRREASPGRAARACLSTGRRSRRVRARARECAARPRTGRREHAGSAPRCRRGRAECGDGRRVGRAAAGGDARRDRVARAAAGLARRVRDGRAGLARAHACVPALLGGPAEHRRGPGHDPARRGRDESRAQSRRDPLERRFVEQPLRHEPGVHRRAVPAPAVDGRSRPRARVVAGGRATSRVGAAPVPARVRAGEVAAVRSVCRDLGERRPAVPRRRRHARLRLQRVAQRDGGAGGALARARSGVLRARGAAHPSR
jgi:hypothetical protein